MTAPTVIVTGASGGLGRGIAIELAKLGANTILTSRRADALEETARLVQEAGAQTAIVVGDITAETTVQHLIRTAADEFGRLDAIIHNAGTLDPIARTEHTSLTDWQTAYNINLFSVVMLTQAALPMLRESKGRVINVSSGASVKGYPTWGVYGATKAALNHFTMTLSAEEPEITSVAVRPGTVDTDMQAKIRAEGADVMPESMYSRFVGLHENKELLDPSVPGHALAVLALYAPPDWSGEYMNWADDRVRQLSEQTKR